MEKNEIIKYDENYFVCVSNAFVKANQDLPLNESKILRIMISQIVATDKELKSYTTTIPDIAKILKIIPDNLYRNIENITRTLMQQLIKVDKGKNKWELFQIFSKCKYDNGILTMRLHDDLKPFIFELKKLYTQYQISVIIGMKSTYAIRVYELIREKRKNNGFIKQDEFLIISLEDLRNATNTTKKYSRIIDFKKNVLDISVKEISCNSEFVIDYEHVKKNKTIIAFKFNLYGNGTTEGEELLKKYKIDIWDAI